LSITREHAGKSPELERLLDMIKRRVLEFHRRHALVDAGPPTGRAVSPRLQ
jgi:hypothetical protein